MCQGFATGQRTPPHDRGRGHVSRLALFDGSSKNLWLAFRRNHQRTESPLESDNWAITRNAGGQNARQTQPANK